MRGRECVVAATLCVTLAALAGTAAAQKTRKVRFESEPPGATIFLEESDSQPLGETPFEKEMPVGTYTVIAELDAYTPDFQSVQVKKPSRRDRKKPIVVTFSLKEAVGVLKVTGPKGARIVIDNVAYGNLPEISDGIPIPVGPHTVEAKIDDKVVATEFVVITEDKPVELAIRIGASGAGDMVRRGEDGPGEGPGDTAPPPRPRGKRTGPIVTVGPLVEFGWRKFRYDPRSSDMNLEIDQGGASVFGLAVDINPFRLTSIRQLHPFAIVLAGAHGFVPQSVTDRDGTNGLDPSLETFWQKFQAGVRYRFTLGMVEADLEGGYGGYVYRFSNGPQDDIDRLPDAAYHTVRLGGRIGVRVGPVTPYVGGESRIVIAGGALEERYELAANADGYAGRAGLEARFGSIAGRIEGSYSRFTWDLENLPENPYQADGAVDRLFGLSFVVAYMY